MRGRKMTRLLQEAFKKASELPETEQDSLAKWLLEELESNREWNGMFAVSEDILGRLANEALDTHRRRQT
jgi:hypothetical protein